VSSRPTSSRPSPTKFVGSWAKVSEYLYVHVSGTRIERRGYPEPHGWYLVLDDSVQEPQWFAPTPQGCDDAFLAFTALEVGQSPAAGEKP